MTVIQRITQVEYPGDGSTVEWDFNFDGGYFERSHVKAKQVNVATGEETPLAITDANFVSAYRLSINPPVPVGHNLVIYRATPTIPMVEWTTRARLDRDGLDITAKQALFVAAENREAAPLSLLTLQDAVNARGDAANSAASASASAAAADASADLASAVIAGITEVGADKGAGLINYSQVIAYLTGTVGDRLRRVILARAAGLDVAGDVATGINTAAALAASLGAALEFTPGRTYQCGAAITVPANSDWRTKGATFEDLNGTASNTAFVQFGANTVIDKLRISIPTGKRRDRVVVSNSAADTYIGLLQVISADQQANTGETSDVAIRITGATNCRIGQIVVDKYDRSMVITGTTGCTIGGIIVTNYVRGVMLEDNKRLLIGPSSITLASPNAVNVAGNNALLMSCNSDYAQQDVTLTDWVIENSGEHGARIGGSFTHRSIVLQNFKVRKVGACGLKVLGTDTNTPTSYSEHIFIINPDIEDCGTSPTAGENRVGIMLEFVKHARISNAICRRRTNAVNSMSYCYRLNACEDVHLIGYDFEGAEYDNILLHAQHGDLTRIVIADGVCRGASRHGLNLLMNAGRTGREISVSGRSTGNADKGVNLSGTFVETMVRLTTYNNTGGAVACNSAAVTFDCNGLLGATPLSGVSANNGSTWRDGSTLVVKKAAGWINF